MASPNRSEKLDLRLTPDAKRTLGTAAAAVECSVSEFVLQSALDRAAGTLADRQRFGLTADKWRAFQAALDAPPRELPRLRQLLAASGPFDRR